MEGIIKAVCISEKRGTVKKNINEVNVIKDFGLEGDAHAGKWHRQVSFLSADIVDEFNEKGASVIEGDLGENILAYGIDFKKLPVGTKLICNDAKFEITQIGRIREDGYYYIDKSGLITNILNAGAEVTLITRPRRFGKTLNMRMLASFFDIRKNSSALFEGLEIAENQSLCSAWMNQCPTLFLTFKDVDGLTFESAKDMLRAQIAQICNEHDYLLDSKAVS